MQFPYDEPRITNEMQKSYSCFASMESKFLALFLEQKLASDAIEA